MLDDYEGKISEKLKTAQINILLELDRVSKKLGLTYCVAFGTAIGAVRHKGFIPWDDDIDVYMTIEDLEQLQNNSDLFNEDFFLQHPESDPEYRLMITRLRNSNTTLIEEKERDRDINHGIFVDIYPLFNCPAGGWAAEKIHIASMLYRLMLYGEPPQNRGQIMKIGSFILLKIIPKGYQKTIKKWAFNKMKSCSKTGYYSYFYGNTQNVTFREDILFPVKWVSFENITVPVEADVDTYLRKIYGDYMKLPPEEERVVHHDYAYIDFDKSYTQYKGIMYCKEYN